MKIFPDIQETVAFLVFCDKISLYNLMEVLPLAYAISDECISCGACAAGCPVNAISEGDGKFVIDPDTCTECGACAEVCPVGAPAQA